ncbi:MAG: alpha/beta hydrolase [Acidimicrobiales bacterium]
MTSTAGTTDEQQSAVHRITLPHNRIELTLHRFAEGEPALRPLLLIHGLGEAAIGPQGPWQDWRGPIWALDLTGHGASTVPKGGGYTCEILMSDVDIALEFLAAEYPDAPPATLHGRGLGAYLALMAAGSRPSVVGGVVLADGPGIAGGGPSFVSQTAVRPVVTGQPTPDPFALLELSCDVRPPDYAQSFVHLLLGASPMEMPLVVTARVRPPWLEAVAREPGVVAETDAEAFARYSA